MTILTKNSEKYLQEILSSLQIFKEVLIYDAGSQDKTLDFARQFPNVNLFQKPFIGFGPSIYNANTAFYKYLKLAEANKAAEKYGDAQKKKPTV